jgi:hypothetical protein
VHHGGSPRHAIVIRFVTILVVIFVAIGPACHPCLIAA